VGESKFVLPFAARWMAVRVRKNLCHSLPRGGFVGEKEFAPRVAWIPTKP